MAIISGNDFRQATGTTKLPRLANLLMRLIKIDAFNDMMVQAGDIKGLEFARFVLSYLDIKIEVDAATLKHIPMSGAFIAVANHPYGAIESLALLNILATQRPDTLFMGNFLLKRVPNLSDYIIAVNPFETIRDSSSISGLKTTLCKLKSGTPVAIFPAGEVAAFNLKKFKVTDREWHPVVGKLIAKAKVPVLPIHFEGNNSFCFSLLRYIHPSLQTAMLPTELFSKKDKVLRVSIGKLVGTAEVPLSNEPSALLGELRKKTYELCPQATFPLTDS
ncbi:1-acyl-sn-glycerol-3-phosphate acyltransferase [Mucilaginibacter myungsuensis]|uniref:1-acyl-sn-glycerol-3-phosphate acyltransferase n=1 Tax=Mucilaginibacter myungsuensis TaxID=649104 RepID=A0A929KTF6_9SPHI|nr:1-acyl-sn-glycerol-3-phosphate acyltransferase [Mucilaginibacter myungsuensis]MBE9661241.1 1-acyl-sn-glycerol-3-phosphate acyltransferase [Mucilaginibacter myungsuensis]MDN3597384.1 1-acyl-sn-glycerol-3-phosphate acyltransferase [Mucilaginibacter myungsuensis]